MKAGSADSGRIFKPRGAAADLFKDFCTRNIAEETVFEGPAGTGKSYPTCHLIVLLAMSFPGIRILICRKTRVSMTESVLVTLERVLDEWGIDHTGAGRANRQNYTLPNGSEIILGGMDRPTRLFSTEYDVIWVEEAVEFTLTEYESLFRALRNGKLPIGQPMILTCNPDRPEHWINTRAKKSPAVKRYLSRHIDNPTMFSEDGVPTPFGVAYLAKLDRMSPVMRSRLFLGIWAAAEGMIYRHWDASIHVRDWGAPSGRWPLYPGVRITKTMLGMDWGSTDPGVLQLWGVTSEPIPRFVLLLEQYQTNQTIDFWAEQAAAWSRAFSPECAVADPSRKDLVLAVNRKLADTGSSLRFVKADNRRTVGIDTLTGLLDPATGPRLLVSRNALVSRDQDWSDLGRPCGLVEEITSYVWKKDPSGERLRDEPDDSCEDHACDVARYCAMQAVRLKWLPMAA